MPTQSTTYNSRVTDEALEKRFRDTFRAQGGAELVDDLYAQGVIVPVVDFTQAATGDVLAQNLQTAWDFSTGHTSVPVNSTTNLITNAGFWQVDLNCSFHSQSASRRGTLQITDSLTTKVIWEINTSITASEQGQTAVNDKFVVFLRAGDTLQAFAGAGDIKLDVWYRQIATVSGDLVNPTGFTSS